MTTSSYRKISLSMIMQPGTTYVHKPPASGDGLWDLTVFGTGIKFHQVSEWRAIPVAISKESVQLGPSLTLEAMTKS